MKGGGGGVSHFSGEEQKGGQLTFYIAFLVEERSMLAAMFLLLFQGVFLFLHDLMQLLQHIESIIFIWIAFIVAFYVFYPIRRIYI